jgi:pimeloyl-ACP methyl ester carboxylesterase
MPTRAASGCWWCGAFLLLASLSLSARAETPRAELGKRLRRFEIAWQVADGERRAAAVAPMTAAVRSFFTLQLSAAASHLDEAWYTVRAQGAPEATERAAIATAVTATPLLAETTAETLSLTLTPFYEVADDVAAAAPDPAGLRLSIVDDAGQTLAERTSEWDDTTGTVVWQTGPLPEGDHSLVLEQLTGERSIEVARIGLSRVERLRQRLETLEAAGGAWPEEAPPTSRATVAAILAMLEALAASRGQETDFPAARMLHFAESLAAAGAAPATTIAAAARGADLWLTLSDGRGEVPVRLRAPADATGPLPVLFLHHGAGGSENMFFETCGAGRAATLGVERGWLVVAPRQGLFGLSLDVAAMLDVLGDSFDIDRTRVFLVGHSMGAGQVAKQVGLHPEAVAAAVALGGGAAAPAGEKAKQVTWFVAAGAADFGRPGAAALAKRLEAAGATVDFREYPDVEHMVIVQAALDDVFRFLDSVAAAGPR